MSASLKKKRDFLLKLAEGRKLSNPGETQWQREIKTDGTMRWVLGVRTKGRRERKTKMRGYKGRHTDENNVHNRDCY